MLLGFLLIAVCVHAQESSPISIRPQVVTTNGQPDVVLRFHIPAQNHLYADRLSVEIGNHPIKADLPDPIMEQDRHSGKMRGVYVSDFVAVVPLKSLSKDETLAVNLQGCDETQCYFPETRTWNLHPNGIIESATKPDGGGKEIPKGAQLADGFKVSARATGFLGKQAFVAFLDKSANDDSSDQTSSGFADAGALATIGLILLGGLALNLTPCVLPMIPINLAILGAGVNGGKRRRGVALGSAYGFGMALAYGGLGLVVVLTGSKFGTLNSSPWFNFAIAIVFAVLGFAMFDKLAIDLSRFQRGGTGQRSKSGIMAFVGASVMGAVSALLAGACVAPVVISVLLLATTSFQQGHLLGLLFPFVLGIGMALPWPFAAGGLSFLPKPGRWMTRVKYAFGVIIFGFAFWYGWLGWNLTQSARSLTVAARQPDSEVSELRSALAAARQSGKPVLVDFRASWCKNCEAMEHTTLRDDAVQKRLKNFEVVQFDAERLDDATIKPVLDEFGVLGLPAFVILRPAQNQ